MQLSDNFTFGFMVEFEPITVYEMSALSPIVVWSKMNELLIVQFLPILQFLPITEEFICEFSHTEVFAPIITSSINLVPLQIKKKKRIIDKGRT